MKMLIYRVVEDLRIVKKIVSVRETHKGFLPLKLLIAQVLLSFVTFADVEMVDGISWGYTITDGEACVKRCYSPTGAISIPAILGGWRVTGIKDAAFSGCYELTSITIPESVKCIGGDAFLNCSGLTSLTLSSGLVSIGASAFRGCNGLTAVTIPSTVCEIGSRAFSSCSNITCFIVSESNQKFKSINGLLCSKDGKELIAGINGAVVVPSGVTRVADCAFYECVGLISVTIPQGVTTIGDSAFRGCSGLMDVTIPSGVTSIGAWAFYECRGLTDVTIPYGVTSVGAYALNGCSKLISLTIPSSVTSIGISAFSGCESLRSVTVPSYVTSISSTFMTRTGCAPITNVVVSEGTETIKYKMFADCRTLESVSIPSSVMSIEEDAFLNCGGLMSITVSAGNLNYKSVNGMLCSKDGEKLFSGINGDAIIPFGVLSIEYGAFKGYSGLKSVTIPESVTNIHLYAFKDCSGLTSVTVPSSVTEISDCAFSGCSSLTNMVLPFVGTKRGSADFDALFCRIFDTVAYPGGTPIMQYYADQSTYCHIFYIPTSLRTVEITDETVVGYGAFYNCSGLTAVKIAPTVTNIGSRAFYNCTSLSRVSIPVDVDIGVEAIPSCALIVPAVLVTVRGCAVQSVYDGVGKSYEVELLPHTVKYGIENVARKNLISSPSAGVHQLNLTTEMFQNTAEEFEVMFAVDAERNTSEVRILPREVTLTSGSASKNCDGTALVCESVSVTGDGFVEDEGVLVNYIGKRVWPGTNDNSFEYTFKPGTTASNYNIKKVNGVLTVTATGVVSIASGVTEIPAGALKDCSEVTEIRIPESVRYIGDDAFAGCVGLKKILLPSRMELRWSELRRIGLTDEFVRTALVQGDWLVAGCVLLAYVGDPNVSELTVPDGIEIIEGEVFAGLYNLQKIHFCGTEKEIGAFAFRDCTYLDDVVMPDSVEVLGEGAFSGCSYIFDFDMGNGVREIKESAFEGCQTIENLVCSTNLQDVGSRAFANCHYLRDIALPLGVTNVSSTAFTGCAALTGVTVSTHVAPLSQWFPEQYKSICSVTIPGDETEMVASMFEGCQSLGIDPVVGAESIVLPEGLTEIPDRAFVDCSSIVQLTLPTGVVLIGEAAFERCQFVAFEMPDAVTAVGKGAFRNCSALKDITLGKSLETIPDELFAGCSSLDSITVPGSVTQLGENFVPYQTSAIYFMSNAPACAENAYDSANVHALVNYVKRGTMGWNGQPTGRVLPTPAVWPANTAAPIKYWEANQFEAVFDANGGYFENPGVTTFACKETTFESYAIPPYDPIRPGYVFTGWWTDPAGGSRIRSTTRVTLTKPNDEVQMIYAHWKKGETKWVTIRFNAMGGTVSPAFTNCVVGEIYGNALKSVVPTKEYYDFYGWYTMAYWPDGELQTAETIVPDADRELFARWEPKTYIVRYHANGGSGSMEDGSFVYGDKFTLAANQFKKAGYAFAGWASTADGAKKYKDCAVLSDFGAIEDGVVDLYAVWIAVDCFYSIRYDSNGGVGTMTNQTVRIGDTVALDPNRFTRTGYAFVGWALRADDYEKVYDDQERVCNLSEKDGDTVALFAVWVKADGEVASNVPLKSESLKAWQNVPGTVAVGAGANQATYQSVWQSGAIGDGESTALSAMVKGEGKIGFWWKVSCEKYKSLKLDNLEFSIDGVAQEPWINGETDWTYLEFDIVGMGDHVLRWTYSKDDEDKDGQDCGWVTGIRWTRKLSTLADYLNCDNLEFTTSGDANWQPDLTVTHDGVAALRSGAIGDNQMSRLEAVVKGGGTISFWWNVSSESYKSHPVDMLTFFIDGEEVESIGTTSADWTQYTKLVEGSGNHTLTWVYSKDDSEAQGKDCGWLDEVSWTPSQLGVLVPAEITGGKEIVVDESWPASLDAQFGAGTSAAFVEKFGSDLSAALLRPTGKKNAVGEDMYVWQDYVAGTDPTDPNSRFTAKIEMVDGEPVVVWSPKLSDAEAAKRVYTTYGKKTLEAGEPWMPIKTPAQGGWRFFKVGVEMR